MQVDNWMRMAIIMYAFLCLKQKKRVAFHSLYLVLPRKKEYQQEKEEEIDKKTDFSCHQLKKEVSLPQP